MKRAALLNYLSSGFTDSTPERHAIVLMDFIAYGGYHCQNYTKKKKKPFPPRRCDGPQQTPNAKGLPICPWMSLAKIPIAAAAPISTCPRYQIPPCFLFTKHGHETPPPPHLLYLLRFFVQRAWFRRDGWHRRACEWRARRLVAGLRSVIFH